MKPIHMSFFLFLAAMLVYAISLNQTIKSLELSIENERLLREYNDKSLEYKIENLIFKQNNWITDPGSERTIDISEQLRRLRLQNVTEEDYIRYTNTEISVYKPLPMDSKSINEAIDFYKNLEKK